MAGEIVEIVGPLLYLAGLLIFYWIIRLGVAHGMRDAWKWRGRNQQQ